MGIHLFGATSSPSCVNYALQKCAEDNKAHFSQQVIDNILYSFYVDDYLASIASEEEAISLYIDLGAICAKGSFRLTKWISNSCFHHLYSQDLCQRGIGWDDAIPSAVAQEWKDWVEELHLLDNISIRQCLKPPDFGETTTCCCLTVVHKYTVPS